MDEEVCRDKPWGFIATSVVDAPECITGCRDKFLKSLLPEVETLDRVCKLLSDNSRVGSRLLHTLYCCDSQICGVNNLQGSGLDPNVNWLIGTCQNIGYESIIVDPGPPDPAYVCSYNSTNGQLATPCSKQKPAAIALSIAAAPAVTTLAVKLSTTEGLQTVLVATQMPSLTTTVFPFISTIPDPSLTASPDPLQNQAVEDKGSKALSDRVKIAIALSAVAAVLAIVSFVAWRLHARKNSRKGGYGGRSSKRVTLFAPAESPTPLVSADALDDEREDGEQLTAPLRLQKRRFLLPAPLDRQFKHKRHSQVEAIVPLSPLSPRAITNVFGRSERARQALDAEATSPKSIRYPPMGTMGDGLRPPWQSDLISSAAQASPSFSVSRASEELESSGLVGLNTQQQLQAGVYEPLPDVDGLASPGPPPTRALPTTPPQTSSGLATPKRSPPSPPVRRSPPEQRSPPRQARATSLLQSNIGIAVGSPPERTMLPQESRDLRQLTEEYARESSNSWGGWRGGAAGVGGGRPGASVMYPKERQLTSPVLEEADLERLAGRY